MHLLITGSHGYIATHYVSYLTHPERYSLRSEFCLEGEIEISTLSHQIQEKDSTFRACYRWEDLENLSIPGTHYLHLAGLAHDFRHASAEQTRRYFQINQGLTERLFDHFLQSSTAKVFVYVSSIHAVNDTNASDVPLDEESLTEPRRPYGTSKLAAEEYIRTHWPEVEHLGKRVYILRPSLLFSADGKGNIRRMARFVKSGLPWPFKNLNPPISICTFPTLLVTLNAALKGILIPGTYHVCDSLPSSAIDMLTRLAKVQQRSEPKMLDLPIPLLRVLAKIGSLLHLPYNMTTFTTLSSARISSNRKLCEALGIQSLPEDAL